MFKLTAPPAAKEKGSVPMDTFAAKKWHSQARPKGRIVGKDQPQTCYRDFLPLADGRVLVAYRGRYIDSPFGLQIRGNDDFKVLAHLPKASGPLSLRPDGKLLASGPLSGGYESSMHRVDLPSLKIEDTWPLADPFLWLPGATERFVAQTPRPRVTALIAKHPLLREALNSPKNRLLFVGPNDVVDHDLDSALIGPEYPVFKHLALSPDGTTLYAATESSLGAISLSDYSIRWRVQVGDNSRTGTVTPYALALSPDGRYLAAGGIAFRAVYERTLMILDATTGRFVSAANEVGRALGNTSIRSLAWHSSGWLAAGTSSGQLLHVDLKGHIRIYKGASKSIEALAFVDEGRSLLVAGAEAYFRVWPLLDDECRVR